MYVSDRISMDLVMTSYTRILVSVNLSSIRDWLCL